MNLSPLGREKLSHKRPTNLKKFLYGCAYYPEHWDENTKKKDPKMMREAGINVVRMGEFAWALMEPKEGKYEFGLFDSVIENLGKEGIMTILCTPTATPPRWLTMKYPEILRVNAEGVSMEHGSRQHCCHSNSIFRQYSREITCAMSEHFAKNPYVIGWQTDNEFNCHFSECHCQSCQIEFRNFLKEKYKDIDKLNSAWGTAFWSQIYSSFDEIITPRPAHPAYPNPSHQLDYFRYLSHSVTIFQHDQVAILRKANYNWFIFHNGLFSHIDYRGSFTKDLDFLGYDSYPQFFYDSKTRRYLHAFNLDRTRAWSGNFIIPEQQSGPGGQRDYFHDNPEPGEMRRMTYVSLAHGADSLLYFRWRTCRFGAEEYWCGILDHDNIPRRRYQEAKQIGSELSRIGPEILGTRVKVDVAVATSDFDNIDAHQTLHLGLPTPDYIAEIIHRQCFERKLAVGCIHPSDDLSDLRLYFIPHWVIIDPTWIPNLEQFVENGGVLVIGARSGTRNIYNKVIFETPPGILTNLCGITIEEYGKCNDLINRPIYIRFNSKDIPIQFWYEVLNPNSAQVVATWHGRHLDNMPAITSNNLGKGSVIYVGTYLTEQIIKHFLPLWIENAVVSPLWQDIPDDVEIVVREDNTKKLWFFINHSDDEVSLKTSPEGNDLISDTKSGGSLMIERNGVVVIKTLK